MIRCAADFDVAYSVQRNVPQRTRGHRDASRASCCGLFTLGEQRPSGWLQRVREPNLYSAVGAHSLCAGNRRYKEQVHDLSRIGFMGIRGEP